MLNTMLYSVALASFIALPHFMALARSIALPRSRPSIMQPMQWHCQAALSVQRKESTLHCTSSIGRTALTVRTNKNIKLPGFSRLGRRFHRLHICSLVDGAPLVLGFAILGNRLRFLRCRSCSTYLVDLISWCLLFDGMAMHFWYLEIIGRRAFNILDLSSRVLLHLITSRSRVLW